jgi:acetyl esterase
VALVWAHGGAFLGGHLDMPESHWVALELAAAGIPVMSIDYTKCRGMDHFPAPVDDVEAGWQFACERSEELLGVPAERLVLGGASAGATLVASAVRRRIDRDRAVPGGLVLVYPALHPDPARPDAVPDPSSGFLEFSLNYAGSPEALTDAQAFPGLGSGEGFPPSLIVACEHDVFVASADSFAATLREAGVPTEFRIEADADHGHINDPSSVPARRTLDAIRAWLVESTHR